MSNSTSPHRLPAAVQQAGYAVLHSALEGNCDRIVTVSIVPSDRALGFIKFSPKEGPVATAEDIKREGLISMAGLIAMRELGDSGASCSAGMLRALTIVERYVYVTEGPDPDRAAKIQEVMAAWDAECTALVAANKDKIAKVRDALLERNALTASDLTALLA